MPKSAGRFVVLRYLQILSVLILIFFPTLPGYTGNTSLNSNLTSKSPINKNYSFHGPEINMSTQTSEIHLPIQTKELTNDLPIAAIEPGESNPINFKYDYSDVLVVYNENSGISTRVAQYFQSARNIANINICNISTSTSETVSRTEFENIRSQVENYLSSNNLTEKINYIVTTKGVPLRVSGGNWENACLDSELTMILGDYKSNIANSGWLINPYFTDNEPFERSKYSLYLVTRLTAYTEQEIYNIIDNATISLGKRGTYVLDADSDKGWTPGGYGDGNIWLRDANITLTNKGEETHYDDTTTFIKSYSDVMGYGSWGSNDGHDTANFVANWNFESISGNLPNNWYPIHDPGIVDNISSNSSDKISGKYSVLINRKASNQNYTAFAQNVTITQGMRYYLIGYINISAINGPGGVHFQIQALDASNKILKVQNSQVWSSATSAWRSLGQLIYEPVPGAVKVRILGVMNQSAGIVFFDDIRFFDIPPHFSWVPGSIAETFVSTGGRSFTYGTWYGQSLVADLLRDGVTGVKGYVYEPFLTAIAHPDILFDRYTDGYNLAESYYMASNFIGWMDVVVGDPKMAPYADNLPDLNVSWEDVSYLPVIPNTGSKTSVTVKITNTGYRNVSNVNVQIYLVTDESEILVVESTIPTLNRSGDWYVLKKKFYPEVFGEVKLRIEVDPDNMIKEIYETNNRVWKYITINSKPIVLALTSSKEVVYRGQTFIVYSSASDLESGADQLIPALETKLEPYGDWISFQEQQIEYQYNYTGDNWDIFISTNYTMELGNYSFRIAYTDENNFTSQYYLTYKAIKVMNNNPIIKTVYLNTHELYRFNYLNITCDAIDLEDASESLDLRIQYRYRPELVSSKLGWIEVDDDDIFFEKTTSLWLGSVYIGSIKVGIYQLRVRAKDQDNNLSAWTYAEPDFNVLNNQPVIFEIKFVNHSVYRSGEVVVMVFGKDVEDFDNLESLTCLVQYALKPNDESNYDNLNWESVYISKIEFDDFEQYWLATFSPPIEAVIGEYIFRTRILDNNNNWSDWCISQDTLNVLNNPPQVENIQIPVWAKEDYLLSFDASKANDVEDGSDGLEVYWEIDVNEGFSSYEKKFSYSFSHTGIYQIRLMVSDLDEAEVWINTTIEIENVKPTAKITIDYKKFYVDDVISFFATESFDTSSDIDSLIYIWDFGDGQTGNGLAVNHSYIEQGEYTLKLNVTDDDGAFDVQQINIEIYPKFPPPPPESSEEKMDYFSVIITLIIIIVIFIFFIILWLFLKRKRNKEAVLLPGPMPTLPKQPPLPMPVMQPTLPKQPPLPMPVMQPTLPKQPPLPMPVTQPTPVQPASEQSLPPAEPGIMEPETVDEHYVNDLIEDKTAEEDEQA